MRSTTWLLVGIVALGFGGLLVGGCLFGDALQACMRARAHNIVALALNLASAFAAYIAGSAVARPTGRAWLGWIVGLVVFVAGSLLLHFVGFPMPDTE